MKVRDGERKMLRGKRSSNELLPLYDMVLRSGRTKLLQHLAVGASSFGTRAGLVMDEEAAFNFFIDNNTTSAWTGFRATHKSHLKQLVHDDEVKDPDTRSEAQARGGADASAWPLLHRPSPRHGRPLCSKNTDTIHPPAAKFYQSIGCETDSCFERSVACCLLPLSFFASSLLRGEGGDTNSELQKCQSVRHRRK